METKDKIADSLLELNKRKTLKSITIKDILNECQISKQTFYNHFLDKNDLIQYIYLNRIIPVYNNESLNNFRVALIDSLYKMKAHHKFLKEACMIEGQNCLKDYIYQHCESFDLKWHQSLYGHQPMSEEMIFITKYHANASSSMTLSWILSDMKTEPVILANLICDMRSMGMDELFINQPNPYK